MCPTTRGAPFWAGTWPGSSEFPGEPMRRLDVVTVGELNPDLILGGMSGPPRLGREILAEHCAFTLGSSTALCAANLAALGLSVGIVGKVGEDAFGEFVVRCLGRRGIDTSRVIRDAAVRTGITVSLAYPEDRAMLTFAGAMAHLAAEEVDREYLASARHLHVSSLFLQRDLQPGCADLLRQMRGRGLTTSLDPGWDPAETWDAGIGNLYGLLDILFLNRVEAVQLGNDPDWRRAAGRLAKRTPLLVVKSGPDGASVVQEEHWEEHPGFPVRAVDPTGAGDAFNAGFLFGYLSGWPRASCLEWGNACGAMTAMRSGGSGAFKHRADVEAFMRSRSGTRD
jgi:sugar/nucleoside kinase (ribokinase family)